MKSNRSMTKSEQTFFLYYGLTNYVFLLNFNKFVDEEIYEKKITKPRKR